MGLQGVHRRGRRRTTTPDESAPRPPDRVNRQFTADRPDRLCLADITYARTREGWVYVAFVLDAFSRRIVGWQLADHLRTDLPLDAPEMALWQRARERPAQPGTLIHRSDRGCQYVSFRYSTRLADLGVTASVGSVADSYDNAMAESLTRPHDAQVTRFFRVLVARWRWALAAGAAPRCCPRTLWISSVLKVASGQRGPHNSSTVTPIASATAHRCRVCNALSS